MNHWYGRVNWEVVSIRLENWVRRRWLKLDGSEGEFQVRHVDITTSYSSSASLSGKPSLFCRQICWGEWSEARFCDIISVSCWNGSSGHLDVAVAGAATTRSRCRSSYRCLVMRKESESYLINLMTTPEALWLQDERIMESLTCERTLFRRRNKSSSIDTETERRATTISPNAYHTCICLCIASTTPPNMYLGLLRLWMKELWWQS